jgi:hypothetical protein
MLKKSNVHAEEASVLEELFLCHYSGDAAEVRALAEELGLRGITPWVDKEGGFSVGDENAGEAERAIGEDCFGLLFYASREAFTRDIIRQIEINKAIRCKEEDPSFVLFAVPRGIDFGELSAKSVETFGIDLAAYASREVKGPGLEDESVLRTQFGAIADGVLDKVLVKAREGGATDTLQIQFSTRERLADEPQDVLCVDAVQLLERASSPASQAEAWGKVYDGLLAVKRMISQHFGRPRLKIHGSKHLTAAFVLGYAFPSTTYELDIRTKREYWATDHEPTHGDLLRVVSQGGSVGSESLYLEISTGKQLVRNAVRRYVRRTSVSPLRYLRLTPGQELEATPYLSNADACAIAQQLRRELAREISEHDIAEVHIFAAVPQGLAIMIGHSLNAMPPVQLYEYDGSEYYPSYRLGQ